MVNHRPKKVDLQQSWYSHNDYDIPVGDNKVPAKTSITVEVYRKFV